MIANEILFLLAVIDISFLYFMVKYIK